MIGSRRTVRTALVVTLASVLFTCGEESTGPESVTLDLFLSAPRDDIRAVVVEIDRTSLTPTPAPGHSVFVHAGDDVTRLVIVADAGATIPTGSGRVATLTGPATRRSSSLGAEVTQAASADYALQETDGFNVRIEPR